MARSRKKQRRYRLKRKRSSRAPKLLFCSRNAPSKRTKRKIETLTYRSHKLYCGVGKARGWGTIIYVQ